LRFLLRVIYILWAIVVAGSAALLAYGGATAYGGHHKSQMAVAAVVLAVGTALPAIGRVIYSYWRRIERGQVAAAQFYAQRLWENLVMSDVGLGLRDVGVHIFVRNRRLWPYWRFTYVRMARMAVTTRDPAVGHSVWPEHWRTGRAPGLVGLAATMPGHDVLDVDLMDAAYVGVTPERWNGWFRERDPRALGVPFEQARNPRRWFSTMWATPMRSRDGRLAGVLTVNIEREIPTGHQFMIAANASELMRTAAQDSANGLR
jgi:hypothetical protein